MAQIKYTGQLGLAELVTKIKAALSNKVDKVAGYSLTKNDLTDALKANYDAAYTHSQADHAPSNAERNIIVGLTVNGTAITPDAETRIAAITTATKTSELTNDAEFQNGTQVSTAISTALASYSTTTQMNTAIAEAVANASHLKYAVVAALPTADISTTTIYLVAKATAEGQNAYTEWMYINNAWEKLGDTMIDMANYYTKTEADKMADDKIAEALKSYTVTSDFVQFTAKEVDDLFDAE